MTSLIKCRKCGGPHVTLRCGKEPAVEPKVEVPKQRVYIDRRKIVTVKITNLPDDITVEELTELMNEWGSIGRINITTYESKSAFIDFHIKSEAEYFVKAIDKTPFDYNIIRAELLEK